jgi:ribose transport system substrate-binding protein
MSRRTTHLGLATAAVLALALTGCSGSGAIDSDGADGGAPRIAFIQGVAGEEFYITMQCGVEAAAKAAGATVTVQGPEKFDPSLQRPIVDSVIASHPDALLIAPTDVSAMQAPLEAAAAAGIKVVLVDTTVDDPSFAVSAVSSDNVGGGAAAFDAFKQLNPEGGKILVISTDPGISTVDQRIEGFETAVSADPSFTYLGVQYSHNDPTQAAQIVTATLQKDPDIVGIFALNILSAEGTASGLRQAGAEKQVNVVGFDAGPAQVEQLREGTVQALIAQQPASIGQQGVGQALAAIDGDEPTASIQTDFKVITLDNVDGDGADYLYKSSC